MKPDEIKKSVRRRYGQIAKDGRKADPSQSCCCGSSNASSASLMIGYSESELSEVPQESDLGLGCGNPIALASLKKGETVLDLGSGAGIDCFLAAKRVGKSGRVIGVDMTHEMLEKARDNARKGGYSNVEFRLGEIEHLPVADNSIDIIISNCVINLVPNKEQVFREAFRALRPGGRLMVSDIVLLKDIPERIKNSVAAYTACVSGASLKKDYLGDIKSAGFKEVKVVSESIYPINDIASSSCACGVIEEIGATKEDLKKLEKAISSIKVSAVKPKR